MVLYGSLLLSTYIWAMDANHGAAAFKQYAQNAVAGARAVHVSHDTSRRQHDPTQEAADGQWGSEMSRAALRDMAAPDTPAPSGNRALTLQSRSS